MNPEPQKPLPPQYPTEEDIFDWWDIYIDYLNCWIASFKGGPGSSAEDCFLTYCKAFDKRFP